MSRNGDGCHWELPLAVDDFPADGIVQVLSDQKAATAALMAVNLKSKELRPWLGQVVKIVEKAKKQVKCQQLHTTNRKAPTIWLAPAALTKPLASEQDLVRRNLAGIYRAVRRRMDSQSTMHVHVLCPEAPQGAEICCRETGSDGEPVLMQGGACSLFWCTLPVGPTFKDQQKLNFILNKDKRMGVIESLESFLGSFRGRNDHGNLLQTEVAISRQAAGDGRCFGQVLFETKEELPQAELHGRFLCAFHHRLEGENNEALPLVLEDFSQLCKQIRSSPDLKEYLDLLSRPISSSQAVLAMCAVTWLVKLPTDSGTFARGELVLVERAKGSNSKSKKGQGERSDAAVCEIVEASRNKLTVRKLSSEVAGEQEEVNVDKVKPLAATCTWSGLGSIGTQVLSAFAACSCRAQDFQALLQQDCWRGLQTMLRADAYRGGAWWLEAVRQMVHAESFYGDLGLFSLLQPVRFDPEGGAFEEEQLCRALQGLDAREISEAAQEALWNSLLGERHHVQDLFRLLRLVEPKTAVPQGDGTEGGFSTAEMMLHSLLGSRSLEKYLQLAMKNARSNGAKRVTFHQLCQIFSEASPLVRRNVQPTFEALFNFAVSEASWSAAGTPRERFEEALSSFAGLLCRDWDEEASKLLQRTARQLWAQCLRSQAPTEACRLVLRSFAPGQEVLALSEKEAAGLAREYVECRAERTHASFETCLPEASEKTRKLLAALVAGTELLNALQEWALKDPLSLISAAAEDIFDAVGEVGLLGVLPGLHPAGVSEEIAQHWVKKFSEAASGIMADDDIFLRTVKLCLHTLSGEGRRHAEAALQALLSAATAGPDPLLLLEPISAPWRLLLQAWEDLGDGLRGHPLLDQTMASLQEWLQAVVAGRITLQRAEEVLNMRTSLVELLLLYKDLHAASGASEPAGTAEVAVQALQDMVSQYADRASAAYAFLSFCRKCELREAAELDAKGQDLLKHDRVKPVWRLAELNQGRWWFCKHEAIQSLPDCAMFVRYVRDWVATRHPSWSGERQRDPEEDKEPENEAADTMQEADEQMLEHEIVTGGYEACRGIVRHLDGLLHEFKCICKSIAETKPERIVLTRLRAVLPLGEAIEVREWLQKAAEVSGQSFSEGLLHSVEKCFQLGSAKADLKALCAASKLLRVCEPSWEQMAERLELMERAIDESRPPALDSILQSGFYEVHSRTVSAVAEQVQSAEDHILLKLREGGRDDIVRALADAKELYDFLHPLLQEDLMPLQDAVEEHSDELIRADTIFALLDMQRFFRILVERAARIRLNFVSENFVWAIKETHGELKGDVDDIGGKLRVCSQHCHGLSNLYKNLSSREEMAGEKIKHASREGVYRLRCRADGVEIVLTYATFLDGRRQQVSFSENELRDLKARALLRSERHDEFVQQVDVLLRARDVLDTLRQQGYPWVRSSEYDARNPGALAQLKALQTKIEGKLQDWQDSLKKARETFPKLSFVYSQQFWILSDFLLHTQQALSARDQHMILSILGFIQGRPLSFAEQRQVLRLRGGMSLQLTSESSLGAWFASLGQRLDQVIAVAGPPKRAAVDVGPMETGLRSVVQPGVARTVLARRGEDVLPLALSFYGGVDRLPQASQMLFCEDGMAWPQLDAFLARCKHMGGLHCLVQVQRLSYSMQHKLVDRIKSGWLGSSFRLVILAIAEDDTQVHTLREIPPQSAHSLSPEGVEDFVRKLAPGLMVVTSEEAGCGKTETIRQRAFAQQKLPVTIPLSGPLDVAELVRRLLEVDWKPFHCLHLDVGPTLQPEMLSDILTQLSLWGVVQAAQADGSLCVLPCSTTFVELANLSTRLLQDLPFCRLVPPKRVRFEMRAFQVSENPRSPVQAVCCMLDALDRSTLNSRAPKIGVTALSEARCQDLLQAYVVRRMQHASVSYTLMLALLRVLAVQLVSFSHSAYFDCKMLKELGLRESLRSHLVEQALEACASFMARSVAASKVRQRSQHGPVDAAAHCAEALQGMSRWSDTKPFLLFNRFDRQTLSLVYREEKEVAQAVVELFQSQQTPQNPLDRGARPRNGLPNYSRMSTEELEERLGRMVLPLGSRLGEAAEGSSYVVSPDNFVKMVWIALRVESKVPVVIMGETGCGKTSLIRHLARLLSVDFRCLNIHAGTSSREIVHFVRLCAQQSNDEKPVWAFLDEVNTCEHMGLITEVLCHHRALGESLPDSLTLLAACNPYRKKPELSGHEQAAQQALTLSDSSQRRSHSELVYSVQELPEALYDYLYDFGFLGEPEEESYVRSMVNQKFHTLPQYLAYWPGCLTELIVASQRFTAQNQPACLLSLRDVKRCVELVYWFKDHLKYRTEARRWDGARNAAATSDVNSEMFLRAVLNGLAVSYHCRLPTRKLRFDYRRLIADILAERRVQLPQKGGWTRNGWTPWEPESVVNWLLKNEMHQYMERMRLPGMTAVNEALLENVFVMMVCILNRIPVFVVGKPGNSKSLALRIINANLRGPDSEDELWRRHPRLYVISYQGSEVSTSEGITKVFEKAKRYRESRAKDALILVHFDEIGLAEASPNNPLKVLHAHLEPGYPKDRPDYAVVGLSNFPLDAAKMNRGITLVRPPPPTTDLQKTMQTLCKGLTDKLDLENLAKAYYQYYEEQPVQDYHGLRDFYFFVKALAKKWPKDHKTRQFTIFRAAFRNFCGLPEEVLPHSEYAKNTPCLFVQAQWRCLGLEQWMSKKTVNVLDLVEENLSDKLCARHLLLVCSGGTETAIGLVQTAASRAGRQIQIMVGSTFPEDRSDHYAFSLLKRITLSMEKGDVLVMRGLDVVHGSLYDMLNMSYTTMGGKQLCRIALGDADMLTEVHESFRCVVLQEKTQLDKLDAAFLNRFEKHCVGIEAGMSEEVPLKTVQMLRHQVNLAAMPRVEEVFVGWGPETAASLVAQVSAEAGSDCDNPLQLLRHCWLRLASVATTDGMLRATELSELAGRYPKWAQEWREHVFTQPQSLPEWIKANGWQHRVEPETPPTGRFAVMITMSPLHINLTELLKEQVPGMACVAVDALTSELDLEKKLQEFSATALPSGSLLLLQCRANSPHVELVRHRVYSQLPGDRRALLLLHGDRKVLAPSDSRSASRQLGLSVRLNFQSGWAQVFLEQLVAKDDAVDIPKCVNLSLESLLDDAGPLHFERVLKSVLTECFWYIKYPPTKEAAEHVKEVSELVLGDPGLLALLRTTCLEGMRTRWSRRGKLWWHKVIMNMQLLRGHASFADCIEAYVRHQIRRPAAMWIQQLENLCALKTLKFYQGECDLRNAWFEICDQVVSLQGVAPPQKSECYPYRQHLQSLHVPFAAYFAEKLDGFRAIFFEHQLHKMDPGNPALRDFRLAMEAAIPDQWMELLRQHRQAYVKDLAVLKLTAVPLPQTEQLRILQPIFQEQSAFEDWGVPEIHQFLWCHQGSLQAVLRQLAAVPSQLRDLEGFMASMIGQERHLVTSDMTTLMHLVTDHACSALHPCAEALNTTNTGWLPNARRVLAAARNALDCSSQHSATQPVSVSALSIMVEVSQRLETDVTEFWRSVLLETPIKRPTALQQLVERLLQGAQAHMDQSSLQHLQLSTYQQLIPHGASDAIVKSLTSGVPVVASALQLRSLVRGACKESSRCLLEALRSASPASRSTPSTALRTLQDLACSAGPGGPLNAVLCIEIEEFGLPWLHLDAANSGGEVVGLPTAVLLAAEILRSFERSKFGLQHVVAAAVLRAAATQAASLLSSESPVAWDGLDHALARLCTAGSATAIQRALGSCLRNSVLREVHARAGNVATTVELCSPVPWLKESLPVPGDMPQLAGHLPAFLGGFCPEAVESAQVIERALQLRQTSDLAAIAEKADAGIWRFGFFAASSNLLCSDPGPDRELREQGRRWLASQPELRSLPALMRCHLEGLPAPLRQGLEARDLAEQLPLLTSLHVAAAISAAPISGLSHPLKLAADGVAGMFLPAMPDDEEQVILQALNQGYANARFHGHTRYECQCGYRFIVADCGQAVQESTCPQCRRRIGGFEYARHGNRRVDASPVVTPATLQSKQGYFPHPASRERSLSVRSISPLSFRALHFLLHSSFFTKLWDTSAWAVQNVAGILEHLRADWDVLTQILGACPAGFLMDVSGKLMFTSRSTVQTVMTQKERLQWERHFAEVIIEPCVDNVQRAEFDAQLSWDRVAGHAEETLPLLLLDRLPPLSARATTDEQGVSAEASQAHRLVPRGCKCLELGAGNFTFALSLARARGPEGLTASTLEPIDVVKARYSRLDDRLLAEIADLEALGVRLLAGVDGTILQNTEVGAQKFDVIIFNFPHGGTFDDTASKISCSDHGALIDGLFGGVKSSLTPDGYFCMTLLKSQYTRWHIQQRANNQGFRLVSDETFDRNSFPEYRPVWGDDRDFTRPSQPWQIYSGEEPKIYRFQPKGRRTAAASSANHPSNTPKPVERALAAVLGTVCDEAPLFCCRMLRLAEKPSLPKLEREFQSKAALSERYPLLAAWLQARQDLQLANNLVAVQDWLRFVQNHFGFKVARHDARMTVYEALQKLEDGISQIPETQGTLTTAARGRQLFDRFCTAWAKCRDAGCMQRHGCKSLTPVGPMSAKSPLSLSCADETTEEGSYVLALVNDLAVRQNTFVETCLEVASQRDGPSARRVRSVTEYWFHQGRVSLPVVKMQDLDPLHLVHGGHLGLSEQLPLAGSAGALAAWETNGFSPSDIERPDLLVSGSTCVFDWELLEQQLAEKVLQKAVHLDTSIDPFPFSGEAFLHGYGFLEEALTQVAQEPSPEEPRQFLLDSGSALNLLCSLQAAIASVRRLSPQPELAVSDFCARWLHETHLHHLTSQLECRGLLVKHLVHLFEVVELYAADEALQQHSLPKPYCAELSTLLPQMKVWDGDAAGVVLDVLRRVVMRFLLHGRTWDAEEEVNAFVEYAMRKIPELDFQSVSGLFDGMKLKHINAAIEHARQLMPKPHSEQ